MADEPDGSEGFSCSSVDQFLRENGFSIEEITEGAMSSLSDDEDDEEELLRGLRSESSRREEEDTAAPRLVASPGLSLSEDDDDDELKSMLSGTDSTPVNSQFVLMHEEDLRMVQGDEDSPVATAGAMATSEQSPTPMDPLVYRRPSQESAAAAAAAQEHGIDDSLDRSMLLGGSAASSELIADDDSLHEEHKQSEPGRDQLRSAAAPNVQVFPSGIHSPVTKPLGPQELQERLLRGTNTSAFLPSLASLEADRRSTGSGSGRVQDDELSSALGVRSSSRSSGSSGSSARSAGSSGQRIRSSARPASTILRRETSTPAASKPQRDQDARRPSGGGGAQRGHEASAASNPWSSGVDAFSSVERELHRRESEQEEGWTALNDLLRKNALPVLRFNEMTMRGSLGADAEQVVVPDRMTVFSLVQEVVSQLERKNQIIQDLVLDANRNANVHSRTESDLISSEKKNDTLQRQLDNSKSEISRLQAKLKEQQDAIDSSEKKLKSSTLKLQQQLKVSEHRVKAKEILVERMQQKLQQQVDKEDLNKSRGREAFRQLQQRDPRKANARDTKSLEFISAYETEREQLKEEIEQLKTQVSQLNAELRDQGNFLSRSATPLRAAPSWDDDHNENVANPELANSGHGKRKGLRSSYGSSDEMLLERLESARREQEQAALKLRSRENKMIQKVNLIEQELQAAREAIAELKEENANLTLEAESRPSIRDYRLSQRRIHQLERQVSEGKLALEEAKDINELRKYMGTKELIERDRLNHRLHLNRLNTLPRETTLEVVKEVCRVLNLTDITLITPSLEKLCAVVTAVPRMEKFIRDVCGFVFLHLNAENGEETAATSNFELEQVIPTLQKWMAERRKLHALEGFKAAIVSELCKRSIEPNILSTDSSADRQSQPANLSRAVHIISELVELERNVLQHREIYSQAATELERRPSVLINQIVRHFSHLFQVKSIEGVLPKMNEIYMFSNEMRNFLKLTRGLLHLKSDSSIALCLDAIRQRLEADSDNQMSPSARQARRPHHPEDGAADNDEEPNYVVENRRASSSAQANLVGIRQVREMSTLIQALKRELGAATTQDILPRTKRLMELLSLSLHRRTGDDGDDEEEFDQHDAHAY